MNTSLWWWALPVLLLPVLWHRRKREQVQALPLATARFLPKSEALRLRTWRWDDVLLLLLRCLLLLALIALLADPVLPWRGSTVLVVPGTAPALVPQVLPTVVLPDRDAAAWLHAHEREFKPDARLLVVGDMLMPAELPRFRHDVTLRTAAAPAVPRERHVALFSKREGEWRRLFGALDGPLHVIVDARPQAGTALIVWDLPEAPPPTLRAPLWWVADASAFPELTRAPEVDGIHYAASPRGRLWHGTAWPPSDAQAARALVAAWQRLHEAPQAWTAPAQALAADADAPLEPAAGALREWLALLLVALFALERMATHVRRR